MNRRDMLKDDCARSIGNQIDRISELRNTHLLVTGGTGFVGSWVAEMISHLNDAYSFGIHLSLLAPHANDFPKYAPHLAQRKDITLLEGDVRNFSDISDNTDWIIHAAGTPDNRVHLSNPQKTMETIVLGTNNILQIASRKGCVKRVLVLSSGLVNGPQSWAHPPVHESVYEGIACDSLTSLYAECKRTAEMIATAYRSQFGLPVVIARPFTFVGPYQHLDRPWAINNFLHEALRGGPIRLQGNGSTVRSFMYGSDMAFWILRILLSGQLNTPYNVGSSVGCSLKELAEIVSKHAPTKPLIEMNTLPGGGSRISSWIPDVTRAVSDCDLQVNVDLEYAVAKTIAWHLAAE